MVAVTLPNGTLLKLSPGPHNSLQKAIVEEFIPRFLPGSEVLYVGDTTKKTLVLETARLKELGFFELAHDTLPDVVAYDAKRNWLALIEAVHSSNPISQLRHLNLERMTKDCRAPRIYISAFENRASLRKWLLDISWETEVWLAATPDHLIHFNGDKFLGPHSDSTT
jgi:type II restriction enzyme